MKTILVLVTHFHDLAQTLDFCNAVLQMSTPANWTCEVAVCDNSRDWPEDQQLHGMNVYRPKSNLGYLNGCSWALERWTNQTGSTPEFVIVSNTDMEYEHDLLWRLAVSDMAVDVGVLAPHVVSDSGLHLNPHLDRPLTLRRLVASVVVSSTYLSFWLAERIHTSRLEHAAPSAGHLCDRECGMHEERPIMYAPHGSMVVLTKRFFNEGGRLAYPCFMYGEEGHIGEEALLIDLQVLYAPQLRATHLGRGMVSRVGSRARRKWTFQSYVYSLRRHHSRRREMRIGVPR